jgi:hypothetical protein
VWEEANDRGYIARRREAGQAEMVTVSASGRMHLLQSRGRAADLIASL